MDALNVKGSDSNLMLIGQVTMMTETNRTAVQKFQIEHGLEAADGFSFELPSGLKVRVVAEDDPFLDEPYQEGTKISSFASGEAGAPATLFGDRWQVHQNDPDCIWPSNFHAHNGVHAETLDCYSGNIYNPRTRKFKRKYRPKQLAAVLAQLPDRVKPKSN